MRRPSSCVYLSRHYVFAAKPWESDLGDRICQRGAERHRLDLDELAPAFTTAIADGFTNAVINKLQYVLAESPWFVTALAILLIAVILGGWRAGVAAVICLAGAPLARAVEQRDDHADRDPRRHRRS